MKIDESMQVEEHFLFSPLVFWECSFEALSYLDKRKTQECTTSTLLGLSSIIILLIVFPFDNTLRQVYQFLFSILPPWFLPVLFERFVLS